MPDFIFDNTVLSNFAAIGKVDLLAKHFEKNAFTTIEVMDELKRGIEKGYHFLIPVLNAAESAEEWLEILVLKSLDENLLRQELNEFLHPGESSCLVLAVSRNMVLVTDDLAARKLATRRAQRLLSTVMMTVSKLAQKDGESPLWTSLFLLCDRKVRSGSKRIAGGRGGDRQSQGCSTQAPADATGRSQALVEKGEVLRYVAFTVAYSSWRKFLRHGSSS